jgi:hypothetical protein
MKVSVFALMMQAVGSFEISVNIYQISRRNIRVPNVVVK